MRILILLLAIGIVVAVTVALFGEPSPRDPYDPDARMRIARDTAGLAVAGARRVSPTFPDEVHGDGARHGLFVSNSVIWRRAFDWSEVDFDRFRGGPAGALLAQAELHERELARAGLVPLKGKGTSLGRANGGGRAVHVTNRQSNSYGGYMFDLDAPRLVHYRVYRGSESGAVLFARLEYTQASRRLEVEFGYADTTVLDRAYPAVRETLEETVDVE